MSIPMGTCPLCVDLPNPSCAFCGGSGECPIAAGGLIRTNPPPPPHGAVPHKAPESNPMARFRAGKPTRSAAIKAMCAHCMGCTYEETEPGFRTMIRECTAIGCPLHSFRPFQPHGGSDAAD